VSSTGEIKLLTWNSILSRMHTDLWSSHGRAEKIKKTNILQYYRTWSMVPILKVLTTDAKCRWALHLGYKTELTTPRPGSCQKPSSCQCPHGKRTTFCPLSLHSRRRTCYELGPCVMHFICGAHLRLQEHACSKYSNFLPHTRITILENFDSSAIVICHSEHKPHHVKSEWV
jgi:hypothetical protein